MNHKTLHYFKSVKDFLVFTLLYTEGKTRDNLLGLNEVTDIHVWYNDVQEKMFPIEDGVGSLALTTLSKIYDDLKSSSVESNELVKLVNETPKHSKPKKDKKDTFIILESGIHFSNANSYLEEKFYVAFPSNSHRLKTISNYCLDTHNGQFYCLKSDVKDAVPFTFRDVLKETGYRPVASKDKVSAGFTYMQINKLVEEI